MVDVWLDNGKLIRIDADNYTVKDAKTLVIKKQDNIVFNFNRVICVGMANDVESCNVLQEF